MTVPVQPPPTIDPVAARVWRTRPVKSCAWLHEEVAQRMQQRLPWIKAQPQAWCHWEPAQGGLQAHGLVQRLYSKAECYAYDSDEQHCELTQKTLRHPMWVPARWSKPTTRFQAPPDAGVQLLWANMALHTSAQPMDLLAQWHQALATNGFLMFSCLGPDTARELRDLYRHLGWGVSGHEFTDMHDWGDMLIQAGFAEPVMDMERVILTYDSPSKLLAELRDLGRNLHPQRFAGLRTPRWHRRLEQGLQEALTGPEHDGRLALTFEIIYGHALKPAPRFAVSAQSSMSLKDMRELLAQTRTGPAPSARTAVHKGG